MVSIFQSEVTALESHVAALQAQIAQAQQRMTALGECEVQADGALQALTSAVQKVSALAPDAIATLKSAVFALFNSGDDGNQPITPAPQPQPDLGQPGLDGSSSPLTEPPYCLLEDCPSESLLGQSVKIACLLGHHDILCEGEILEAPSGYQYQGSDDRLLPTHMVFVEEPSQEPEKNLFNLISVSTTVSYMRKDDGEIVCAYAGFSNKTKAKLWGESLAVHHSVASGFEVRESKRLTDYKHELKLWGMSLNQIHRLAGCDLIRSPPSNYGDAPKRKVEPVPSMIEIEDIGIGDTVRSITVKNWQFKVTKINSDGFYECDRLNTNPTISQVMYPGSVELVQAGRNN